MTHSIFDVHFDGDRSCYCTKKTLVERVVFSAGRSALMHSSDISAIDCEFHGEAFLWNSENVQLNACRIFCNAFNGLWYSKNIEVNGCLFDAEGMFRRTQNITITKSNFSNAGEILWDCEHIEMRGVDISGASYAFMHSKDIVMTDVRLQGKQAFSGCRNMSLSDAYIESDHALRDARDITIFDSVLNGECIGWNSHNIRLVNCILKGAQPFCHASDIRMDNCRLENGEGCFENTSIHAEITGHVRSIVNPLSGVIRADSIQEVILNEFCLAPDDCQITVNQPGNISSDDYISRF